MQNPLIYRDLLIVAPQTSEVGVVAYDKVSGAVKWKSAALGGIAGYVTPSLVKVGGEGQLVMTMGAVGRGRNASGASVNGVDPSSGKVLWTYTGFRTSFQSRAIDGGQGRVLIAGIRISAPTRRRPFYMTATSTLTTPSTNGVMDLSR